MTIDLAVAGSGGRDDDEDDDDDGGMDGWMVADYQLVVLTIDETVGVQIANPAGFRITKRKKNARKSSETDKTEPIARVGKKCSIVPMKQKSKNCSRP